MTYTAGSADPVEQAEAAAPPSAARPSDQTKAPSQTKAPNQAGGASQAAASVPSTTAARTPQAERPPQPPTEPDQPSPVSQPGLLQRIDRGDVVRIGLVGAAALAAWAAGLRGAPTWLIAAVGGLPWWWAAGRSSPRPGRTCASGA